MNDEFSNHEQLFYYHTEIKRNKPDWLRVKLPIGGKL